MAVNDLLHAGQVEQDTLAHAAATLADDGLLYSLNAHGKGLTGIHKPSDYAAPGLSIATLAPVRRFPWQMFATVPYEVVMRRGEASPRELLPRRHTVHALFSARDPRPGLSVLGDAARALRKRAPAALHG